MGLLEAHAGLSGKVAAVLGGADGLGRHITLGLARAGIDVAVCDIEKNALDSLVAEVEALGVRILPVHGDVTNIDDLDAYYDRLQAGFDQLDILVNVVGGVKRTPFMETTREQHARDIRINYGYVVDSVYRAIPLIRKGGNGGSIINFTTIEAHRGAATFAVYAGAKAATTNFSRAIAVEFGGEEIRVNLIAPDTSPARGSNAALYDKDLERLSDLGVNALGESYNMYIPQKRPPTEDDIVNAVLFLASDLSRSITGTTVHVDGGTNASLGFIDWPYDDGPMPAPLGGTLKHLFPKN